MLLVNAGNNCLLLYKVTDMLGSLSLFRKFPVIHSIADPPSVTASLTGHSGAVISTSNELLVSSSEDHTLCLWQLPSGSLVRQMPSSFKQSLTSCRFLPGNNNLVVTGSVGGLVQIINISTGIFPASGTSTVPGAVLSLAVSSQDNLVWAGTDRGTVISFRVDTKGKLTKGHRMVVSEAGQFVTFSVTVCHIMTKLDQFSEYCEY